MAGGKPTGPRVAAVIVLILLVLAAYPAARAAEPEIQADPEALCLAAAEAEEKAHNMPRQLMVAIALTESGRYRKDRRRSVPWPWTVTAGEKTWYLESRAEAVVQVRRLQNQGVQNIDVGCMQVNLMHHPHAFASLEEAFDPARNAAYGARYLRQLHGETHSWSGAVSNYHSRTPERQAYYRRKVFDNWALARRQDAAARREALHRAYAARRAAREAAAVPENDRLTAREAAQGASPQG